MNNLVLDKNLPLLTSNAIETLQQAFVQCSSGTTEGLILAAMVKIKQVHDALSTISETRYESDPSDYCAAI